MQSCQPLIETNLLVSRQPHPLKRREMIQRIPVGRFGRPEDIAYLALFIASDFAGFISGQQIIVDGVLHLNITKKHRQNYLSYSLVSGYNSNNNNWLEESTN
jgi:hypothetical protein